ncbi:MAG TPA: hypothetical protein VFT40_04715 [Sphingomicrobium sp.]|nr:hypothetical protein [Sphingomicrobium sp.]
MARIFVPIALASALFAAPLQAQVATNHAPSPWQVPEDIKSEPERSFDIADDAADPDGSSSNGSRIIAGTEVMANTAIGFGIFGEKAERPDHARSTNRDYSMPKTRKAAFGVALRF